MKKDAGSIAGIQRDRDISDLTFGEMVIVMTVFDVHGTSRDEILALNAERPKGERIWLRESQRMAVGVLAHLLDRRTDKYVAEMLNLNRTYVHQVRTEVKTLIEVSPTYQSNYAEVKRRLAQSNIAA